MKLDMKKLLSDNLSAGDLKRLVSLITFIKDLDWDNNEMSTLSPVSRKICQLFAKPWSDVDLPLI